MNLLNQRIALAGVMGMEGPWLLDPLYPDQGHVNTSDQHLPELTLDWLHDVEKKLSKLQFETYETQLKDVSYGTNDQLGWITRDVILSTKEQRSEAVCRTLGLWKEERE